MKNKRGVTNMRQLEQELNRIHLETKEVAEKIEEQLQYGKRNILSLSINSFRCKKNNTGDDIDSVFDSTYKGMAMQGIKSIWRAIRTRMREGKTNKY